MKCVCLWASFDAEEFSYVGLGVRSIPHNKKPEVLNEPPVFVFRDAPNYSALPSEPRTSLILWM